jgi:hypothetical protein
MAEPHAAPTSANMAMRADRPEADCSLQPAAEQEATSLIEQRHSQAADGDVEL